MADEEFTTPRSSDRPGKFSAIAHQIADAAADAALLRENLWEAARRIDFAEGVARISALLELARRLTVVAGHLTSLAGVLRSEAGITDQIRAQVTRRIRVHVVVMGILLGVAGFFAGRALR